MYILSIERLCKSLGDQGLGDISKTSFAKRYNEQKIVENSDRARAEGTSHIVEEEESLHLKMLRIYD